MNYKNKIVKYFFNIITLGLTITSCQKMDRPALGDYPKDDQVLPPGDLRFYVPFDTTSDQFRFTVRDSISGNPAFFSSNPLLVIPGVRDSGVNGTDQNAILYLNANDFAQATSFTVAFWEKNSVPTGGSPQFVFSLPSKDYWHQSALFWLIDHDGAGSTADSAATSFVLQDNWFVTHDAEKLPGHILNGQWHHLAVTYDETTSKITYYVDGNKVNNVSDASRTWLTNGSPHGPVTFTNTYNFVLGGWNKHAGLGNGAPTDAWIQSWQGGLDQFRLYNKALSDSEVQALYNSKL